MDFIKEKSSKASTRDCCDHPLSQEMTYQDCTWLYKKLYYVTDVTGGCFVFIYIFSIFNYLAFKT